MNEYFSDSLTPLRPILSIVELDLLELAIAALMAMGRTARKKSTLLFNFMGSVKHLLGLFANG